MLAAVAPASHDDREITELLHAGKREAAFSALQRRYADRIYRLCCALLREPALAEDAAQESLVRIWKALDSYDGRAALSTWIYAIARNRCLSALQRRRAMASLSELPVAEEVEARAATAADESAEQLTRAERAEQLRELVDGLPERLRQALVLYYYEERSVGEVALMLGCPEGTVKTNLFRARAALTEQLRRRGLDDPRAWLESDA
jgi:RNA polymerase sigma-70 factor, ECF subfamily